MKLQNTRPVVIWIADLPKSFEEKVDGRMYYGDDSGDVIVSRSALELSTEDFKQEPIYLALKEFFDTHPDVFEITLQSA